MSNLQISFNKLDDDTWGVRLYDQAPGGTRHMNRTGDTVEVALRDGTTKQVTLGAMRFTGNGDKAYYELAKKSGAKPKAATSTGIKTDDMLRQEVDALAKRVTELEKALAALLAREPLPF